MKHTRKQILQLPLFLALAFGMTGCSWILTNTAVDTFKAQHFCPKDRIKIKYVALKPQDIFERPAPPAEIAADPGRLKVWTQTINDFFKNYEAFSLVESVGCDAHVTYFCWMEEQGDESPSFCDPVDLDNPRTRLGPYLLKASAAQTLKERLQEKK